MRKELLIVYYIIVKCIAQQKLLENRTWKTLRDDKRTGKNYKKIVEQEIDKSESL